MEFNKIVMMDKSDLFLIKPLIILSLCCGSLFGCHSSSKKTTINATNLVLSNKWFISGPTLESEDDINKLRKKEQLIKVTSNNTPTGEIELNVMVTPSVSNDGPPTALKDSDFLQLTYKSSHLIKIQAREGNIAGTGCVHGGSHPRVDLQPSPEAFRTIQIQWSDFKLDGKPDGKLLDINNLCKLNFVNYHPCAGAALEISSLKIENFRL